MDQINNIEDVLILQKQLEKLKKSKKSPEHSGMIKQVCLLNGKVFDRQWFICENKLYDDGHPIIDKKVIFHIYNLYYKKQYPYCLPIVIPGTLSDDNNYYYYYIEKVEGVPISKWIDIKLDKIFKTNNIIQMKNKVCRLIEIYHYMTQSANRALKNANISHNDAQENNILVTNKSGQNRIIFIDIDSVKINSRLSSFVNAGYLITVIDYLMIKIVVEYNSKILDDFDTPNKKKILFLLFAKKTVNFTANILIRKNFLQIIFNTEKFLCEINKNVHVNLTLKRMIGIYKKNMFIRLFKKLFDDIDFCNEIEPDLMQHISVADLYVDIIKVEFLYVHLKKFISEVINSNPTCDCELDVLINYFLPKINHYIKPMLNSH